MKTWAERLLYLGLSLFAAGVVLRLAGYNQWNGFLQGFGFMETGLTPRAFLQAGAVCGIFSIAFGVIELTEQLSRGSSRESE